MNQIVSLSAILGGLALYQFGYVIPATFCLLLLMINRFPRNSNGYKYPPGPFGLPILGNLPWMVLKAPTQYYNELNKKYGNIFSLKLGPMQSIVINGYETIKEFANHPDFQDRPPHGLLKELLQGYGIIDAEGGTWKHQRRFVLHKLKDFGMGKLRMEEKIIDEYQHVIAEIRKSEGKPLSVDLIFQKASCNLIFNMICDKRFDYDDPDFILRLERLIDLIDGIAKTFLAALFPKLRFFIKRYLDRLLFSFTVFRSQANEFIQKHKGNVDVQNPRDLIDLYLCEMNKTPNEENAAYLSTFTEKQLQALIVDLFIAGTETTGTTTRWALVYMLNYPSIQDKVYEEIKDVVGLERPVSIKDLPNLPFTTAAIFEVERLGNIVPWGLPRSNGKAAEFKGYKFPPRSMFYLNLFGVHRDEKLWKNPNEFDPTRFIDDKGKAIRPPYLMPFGAGKRYCPGEPLGRMETFLLFAALMQNFKFSAAGNLPSYNSENAFFRAPKPYYVIAKARF